MKRYKNVVLWILAALCLQLIVISCTTIDLYEKNATIPKHSWSNLFKPEFTFTIRDTTVAYQLFLVIRHTEKYNFNNIWLNLYIQAPGEAQTSQQIDIPLASNEKGWLGKGMDDIFEHRYKITRQPIVFRKAGTYSFTLEQIMRENPLEHVLDVGLRVEKSHS